MPRQSWVGAFAFGAFRDVRSTFRHVPASFLMVAENAHSLLNLCLQELRRDRTKPPRFLRRQSITNGMRNDRLRKRNSVVTNQRNSPCSLVETIVVDWFFLAVPPYRSFYPVKVLYQYNPVHSDELALKPNDVIHVIRLVSSQVVDGEMVRPSMHCRPRRVGTKVF